MKQARATKPLTKYILLLLAAVLLAVCLLCPAAQAEDPMGVAVNLSTLTADHTLTDGTYHLTKTTSYSLIVGGTVTLWLEDAAVLTDGAAPALFITDGAQVTIRLVGKSSLRASADEQAGVVVSNGATLMLGAPGDTGSLSVSGGLWASGIAGPGALTVAGGALEVIGGDFASGIGCDVTRVTGGTVAASGGIGGAGIGGGLQQAGGMIEITGGTVIATGGKHAPGIGSGARASAETPVYISGGSVRSIGGESAKKQIDTVKESATATVPSVPVMLTGWQVGEAASFVRLSTGVYGSEQMYASADGAFYLWIPEGATVRRMVVENTTYLFELTAGTDGTYVHATTDTVLDVSEGQIRVNGGEAAYTITGVQTETDQPILLSNAAVTFYKLKATSTVRISGTVRIHLIGENTLEGTTETPLLVETNGSLLVTGEELAVTATNAPAVQATNASLQIGTAEKTAVVTAVSVAGHSAFDGAGGTLIVVGGNLTMRATAATAVRAQQLKLQGGVMTVTASGSGAGVTAATFSMEGGAAVINGTTGISATECTVSGGELTVNGSDAGISAPTVTLSGGHVTATAGGSGAAIGSTGGAGLCRVTISGGIVNATANGSGAAIGSGTGAAACIVHIGGGRVQAVAKGGGAGIGGGADVAGGYIQIEGGTVNATAIGAGGAVGAGRSGISGMVLITGGSVFCHVQGTEAGSLVGGGFGQQAVAPINGDGAALLATTVTGIARDLPVTSLTTQAGTAYGTVDVYPTEAGAICVWLPAEDAVLTVENSQRVHTGRVPAGTSGKCVSATVTLPVTGTIVIDAYGYQIGGSEPIEHTGDYLITESTDATVVLRGVATTITLVGVTATGTDAPLISLEQGADVTLCISDENRITMLDSNPCIAISSGSRLTIQSGSTRGVLTLTGGLGASAILGEGSVLQKGGAVTCVGGAGAAAAGVRYAISGGTLVHTDGEGVGLTERRITVSGGMVILPAGAETGVQNEKGRTLYPVWVRGLPANTIVTACAITDYGVSDLYTTADGTVCLWLPVDGVLTSVTVDGVLYKCNIPANGDDVARIYYAITFYEDADGNRVTADVTEAYEGQTVTVTVTPGDNRKLVGIPSVVLDGVSYPVALQGDAYTFVMPIGEVSLTCGFLPIVITVPAGEVQTLEELVIDTDQRLVLQGTLIITGTLENAGEICVTAEGCLELRQTLTNHGTIHSGGLIVMTADAVLENAGTVTTAGQFENNGRIVAHFGSTFTNTGDYLGDGSIDGEGKVDGIGLPTWAILLIVIGSALAAVAIGAVAWIKRPGKRKALTAASPSLNE